MEEFTIAPARYAKGQLAVRCRKGSGFKTRAMRLIGDGLNCRWTGRERAYIASPAKAAKFERLYAAGFSACVMSGAVYHPDRPGENMTVKEALRQIDARGDLSASQHRSEPAAVKLGSAPATQRDASETGNGAAIEPDPSSMESEGHPHSVERPGRAARARLIRRCIAMRHQRELDRLALDAAGDYVRQADAERDAAKIAAIPPPVHLDQAPGYGVIAQLHREREAAAVKLAAAETRAAALERANERLSNEIGRLSGRAIRAEQALQVYRVPVLAIADQRDLRSVEMTGAGR